jgi:uncharacterized phage infection (PIP) family protein YhgE
MGHPNENKKSNTLPIVLSKKRDYVDALNTLYNDYHMLNNKIDTMESKADAYENYALDLYEKVDNLESEEWEILENGNKPESYINLLRDHASEASAEASNYTWKANELYAKAKFLKKELCMIKNQIELIKSKKW